MRCSIQVLFLVYTRIFYCRLFTLSGFNFFSPSSCFLTPVFAFSSCFAWISSLQAFTSRLSNELCYIFFFVLLEIDTCDYHSPGTENQNQVRIRDLPDWLHREADHVPVGTSWMSLLCASSSYLQNIDIKGKLSHRY